MNIKLHLIITSLTLSSCAISIFTSSIAIEVVNTTQANVENVKISTSNGIAQTICDKKIEPNSSKVIELDLTEETVDGGYFLEYKQDRKIKSKTFGYFTNGSPMEDSIKLIVERDTVLIQYTKLVPKSVKTTHESD